MEQARLSPGQAGVINGWGLFSTLRVYDGQPFAFERHWKRLVRDAARIQLPLEYPPESVRTQMLELIAANQVRSGCVRIYFIHNRAGIWRSDEPFPVADLVMYTTDLPTRVGATKLSLFPQGRHAAHPLTGAKITSWLNNAWVVEQAHQRGFDDALLLNEHGNVSECTAANIFCVLERSVVTPPLTAGCLPGVSREILLEIASAAGIPITERDFTFEEMKSADEVFITSTTRQVQAISQVEDVAFSMAPGPVTERLGKLFSDYVADYISRAGGAKKRVNTEDTKVSPR
jgi:branched-chain amino acid aminotransferase